MLLPRLAIPAALLTVSFAFASPVNAQIQFGAKTLPAVPSAGTFQLPAAKPLVTTTLSYTLARSGTQIIAVTLNGTVSANFIFDTGSNFSGISQTLVSRLKLTTHPAIGLDGLHIRVGGIRADAADIQFDIGSFRLPRSPFIVIGGTTLSALAGQTVDGIIGADQLTVTPALLDVSKHQIMFLSHGFLSLADLRQLGMEDAVVVPVQDKGDDFLFKCAVRFRNGEREAEENLLIDTGASITSLSAKAADKLGLKAMTARQQPTLFGTLKYQTGSVTITSLGSTPVLWPLLVDWTYDKDPPGFGGIGLGLDVLSKYRVLLDYQAKKMYLKPVAQSAEAPKP